MPENSLKMMSIFLLGILLHTGVLTSGFLLDTLGTVLGDIRALGDTKCRESIAFTYIPVTHQHQTKFVYDLSIDHPVLVRTLALDTTGCTADRHLVEEMFTLNYTDASDMTEKIRVYSENLFAKWSQEDVDTMFIELGDNLFTKSLHLGTSHILQCSTLYLYGCETASVCTSGACDNGGTCIGEGRCACGAGYYGARCEIPIENMPLDDFSFIGAINNHSIQTASAEFTVTGEVELLPVDADQPHRRCSLCGIGCLFHGLAASLTCASHHIHSNYHGATYFHPSPSTSSVFGNILHGLGFSHTCAVTFGNLHNHLQTSYLYTTHGHNQTMCGTSLHYTNGILNMLVNLASHHFHLSVPFFPTPSNKYTVTSSYSPLFGVSLYVNGQYVGSQAKPQTSHACSQTQQQPLCIGTCGSASTGTSSHLTLSNIVAAGCSIPTLAVNGLLSLLGNGVPTLTTVIPNTPPVTSRQTSPTTVTTTRPPVTTVTTTLPPATATSAARKTTTAAAGLLCYNCGQMTTDGSCSSLATCQTGEVCAVYHDSVGYTHRCLDKQICEIAQNRTTSNCWNCCSGYLCNDRCPVVCSDTALCSQVQSTGYNVCGDALLAKTDCKKTCGQCGISG